MLKASVALLFSLVVAPHMASSRQSQSGYFPDTLCGYKQGHAGIPCDWYGGQLMGLHEPSLFALSHEPATTAYRFLWLRTFHHPVAVRVDIDAKGIGTLTTKMADGAGGYKPGELIINRTRILTADETRTFVDHVKTIQFWTLPTKPKEDMGCDGSEWIIEGVEKGKYHLAQRWTPTSGQVFDFGSFAIRLAGLSIPDKEMY